jgi:hypothetical protein
MNIDGAPAAAGNGGGTVTGPGWGTGQPIWGQPDKRGWQVWEQPFTLPVTRANWPARYVGALNPNTHSDAALAARDVLECRKRLGSLDLLGGMSTSTEEAYFKQLREQCVRLVEGWPGQSNYSVGLEASADGARAPQLSLRLVSQLQMSALSPYMARVLGLYFVDTEADAGKAYDYCIAGVWAVTVPPQVLVPGNAPTGSIARGDAQFDGMHITAGPDEAHLYAWQSDGSGTVPPALVTGVPPAVASAMGSAVSTLAAADRPPCDQALSEHERLPMPFELGYTLLVKGMIERRASYLPAARAALGQALGIFQHLGSPLWAAKAGRELSAIAV